MLDFGLSQKQYNDIMNLLKVIHADIHILSQRIDDMALDLTALTEEVTRLETVEASAVTLLHTLMDEVVANKDDPAALQALVDRIKASDDALAAAVVANTPAV